MKRQLLLILPFLLLLFSASSQAQQSLKPSYPAYVPESKELYDQIVRMDSTWEDAYNHCKMDVMDQLISDNLEFYHDRGGLTTSKTQLMNGLKNNICGQVTRELFKGSIEVYPIKDYGAVEMGYHRFHSIHDTDTNSHYAKFVHIWKNINGKWVITRVISLH